MEEDGIRFETLPPELCVYPHQIGGHGLVNVKLGKVMCDVDNAIFKPVQSYPKGQTEINFYRSVFNPDSNKVLTLLRQFVPTFRGLYYDPVTNIRFIRMEDVLRGVSTPSVADIKVGAVSYEPDSEPAKIAIEKAKYFWREEVGFLITGMKVFNDERGEYDFFDRFKGRGLNPEEVYTQGIRFFLGPNKERAVILAKNILPQLDALRSWFLSQSQYAFIASSLLLAYEGKPESGSPRSDRTVVKWVDFTHMIDVAHRDDNFLFGLEKLMDYFTRLVDTNAEAPYLLPVTESSK